MLRFLLAATFAVVLLAPAPASAQWLRPVRVETSYYYAAPPPVVTSYYGAPAPVVAVPAPVVTYPAAPATVVTSYYYPRRFFRPYFGGPLRPWRYYP